MVTSPVFRVTVASEVSFWKAREPIELTLLGTLIVVNEVSPENAYDPIVTRFEFNVTLLSDVLPWNA